MFSKKKYRRYLVNKNTYFKKSSFSYIFLNNLSENVKINFLNFLAEMWKTKFGFNSSFDP